MLTLEDFKHLHACDAWLVLGDYLEANKELDEIAPLRRAHPEVLDRRCQIYAKAGKWDVVLPVLETILRDIPKHERACLLKVECYRHLDGLEKAFAWAEALTDDFPESAEVAFNAARYSCLVKNMKVAEHWVKRCVELGGQVFQKRVLNDPDFELVWK
jgi:tetratricopeptide (TPR) repeat protein